MVTVKRWAVVLLGACLAQPAAGQSVPAVRPVQMTVSPQAIAKPELRYALLPRARDMRRGNAAMKYLLASAQLPRLSEADAEAFEKWQRVDMAEPPANAPELDRLMRQFEPALRLTREGALMESVEWQTDLREKGVATLLPWLSHLRQIARAQALQARLAVKRHDWASAQEHLQTGYALSRHLGQGDTLVEALVGMAIAGLMNQAVEAWINEPGSPNLYWAISNLPAPFNDLRRSLSYERDFVYFELQQLRDWREGRFTVEGWMGLMEQVLRLGSMGGAGKVQPVGTEFLRRQATGLASGIVLYPEAKKYLVAHGRTAAAVEGMPVPEVLGRYFMESFEEAADDVFKWMALPPAQALPGLREWEQKFEAQKRANAVNLLAAILLPSLTRVVETRVKLDRQIAGLRVVEAVRAHAAEKGSLPMSAADLALPLPEDPLGKPFEVRREGDMVVIEAKGSRASDTVRYEVKLRR